MLINSLVLGIDLGTTGLRIAIINTKKQILFTSSMRYSTGLEIWEDWIYCLKKLIKDIIERRLNEVDSVGIFNFEFLYFLFLP